MRRSSARFFPTVLGILVGVAATLATTLAAGLGTPVQAAPATPTASTAPTPSITLAKKSRGVQSGTGRQRVTAAVNGTGRVTFTLTELGTGPGAPTTRSTRIVKVAAGRAVYRVPPLTAGTYRVTATWGGRRATTRFTVYDARLTLNATSFTFSRSQAVLAYTAYAHLRGRVTVDGRPATGGYVDFYLGGEARGGSNSPDFLGFTPIEAAGRFDTEYGFGQQIVSGPSTGLAGGNLAALPAGTYTFRASYTDDKTYGDYISSQLITVVVTD